MIFKNTSIYPDAELRTLIEFATKGVNMTGVAVHVKNRRRNYTGWAYQDVPFTSEFRGRAKYMITMLIGPGNPGRSNIRYAEKRTRILEAEYRSASQTMEHSEFISHYRTDYTVKDGTRYWYVEDVSHPYGGKTSPLIVTTNWQEAVIHLAAHEARHIWQYQRGKRSSEVDCERFAAKALERYRATIAQPKLC